MSGPDDLEEMELRKDMFWPRDMKKFTANIASSTEGKDPFTNEDLQEMKTLTSPSYKIITVDFNRDKPVGFIESVKIEGDKVFVGGMLEKGFDGYYMVPGGKKTKHKKIVTEVALTKNPVDKSLTPLQYIDE